MRGKAKHIREDTARCDLRSCTRATDNERLFVVPLSVEQDDIVAPAQGGKGVRLWVAAELHLHLTPQI